MNKNVNKNAPVVSRTLQWARKFFVGGLGMVVASAISWYVLGNVVLVLASSLAGLVLVCTGLTLAFIYTHRVASMQKLNVKDDTVDAKTGYASFAEVLAYLFFF
jgi:hypothetical protein